MTGSRALRDPRFAPQIHRSGQLPTGDWIFENLTPLGDRFRATYEPIFHWAAHAPTRLWMAERQGESWFAMTYAEAADAVSRIATGLGALGLGPGKTVLVLARNGIDNAILTYGAHLAGAAVAAVSPRYAGPRTDFSRLTNVLKLTKPAALFVDDTTALATITRCAPEMGRVPVIVPRISEPPPDTLRLDQVTGSPKKCIVGEEQNSANLIMMTSGSTGASRAVVCTQSTMSMNAAQTAACYQDPDPPVVVNSAPWSHALGSLSIRQHVLHRGGSMYIDCGEPTKQGFHETLRNLREISPTYHHTVPAGWALLADALEKDSGLAEVFFRSLRLAAYGGAGLPQGICDRIQAVAESVVGVRISWTAGYGCTESGPVVCNVHWPNTQAGLIGLPIPGTAIKLVQRGGKLEICAKGPQITPGYLTRDDALTALALDSEGYYPIGDAGRPRVISDRLVLEFDGRLVENFKLSTGTFVSASMLRLAALSEIGGVASDCIVCGEGKVQVGLLIFLDANYCRAVCGQDLDLEHYARQPLVREAIRRGLASLNAKAQGSASSISRAMILGFGPDQTTGEVTEKGSLNQSLCRIRYADYVDRLYRDNDEDVISIGDPRAGYTDLVTASRAGVQAG